MTGSSVHSHRSDPGAAAVDAVKAGVDLLLYPLDVNMGDLIDYFGSATATQSIILYIESIQE